MKANNVFIEPRLVPSRNEDGPFHYIGGWDILAQFHVLPHGTRTFEHRKLFNTKEEAEKVVKRIHAANLELNLVHWVMIHEDLRSHDEAIRDMEEEWNAYAMVERMEW